MLLSEPHQKGVDIASAILPILHWGQADSPTVFEIDADAHEQVRVPCSPARGSWSTGPQGGTPGPAHTAATTPPIAAGVQALPTVPLCGD